jgi:SAM-dependent methyltransferase
MPGSTRISRVARPPIQSAMATELRTADKALQDLPDVELVVETILARVRRHADLPPGSTALDIGAAQGLTSIALYRAGFRSLGVEPWSAAVGTAAEVAGMAGAEIEVVEGVGEALPFPDASIDLVLAQSVLEHVEDPARVFQEAARVLRPGGAFYFYSTNALCPKQHEIRFMPLFPWYPASAKRRIMRWASEKHPGLIHDTELPAWHWYTQRRYERLALGAGFTRVVDRWGLRLDAEEPTRLRRAALGFARSHASVRLVGELTHTNLPALALR